MKTALVLVAALGVLALLAIYCAAIRRRNRRILEADLLMMRPETIEERARRMGL